MRINYKLHIAKLLYSVALCTLLYATIIVLANGYNISNQVMGIGTLGVIVVLIAVMIDPRCEG